MALTCSSGNIIFVQCAACALTIVVDFSERKGLSGHLWRPTLPKVCLMWLKKPIPMQCWHLPSGQR